MRWYASLRRPGEIAFVRRNGKHAGAASVIAHAADGRGAPSRVAITVSKAVGNAVVRNRVKRRIKGAMDGIPPLPRPLRIVIVARPPAGSEPYERLARDVETVVARLIRA